jgi:hypothetical protein
MLALCKAQAFELRHLMCLYTQVDAPVNGHPPAPDMSHYHRIVPHLATLCVSTAAPHYHTCVTACSTLMVMRWTVTWCCGMGSAPTALSQVCIFGPRDALP